MTTKEKMTPAQARTFNGYSVANAIYVVTSLECGCEPYVDVFTYNRWQAQGFQVQRGEKAIKIVVTQIELDYEETGEVVTKKVLGRGAVFCRHQVKEVKS